MSRAAVSAATTCPTIWCTRSSSRSRTAARAASYVVRSRIVDASGIPGSLPDVSAATAAACTSATSASVFRYGLAASVSAC